VVNPVDLNDPDVFAAAVEILDDFRSGPSKLLGPNFAVAIAVMLHRNDLIHLPGGRLTSAATLQHDICDQTWSKSDAFLPDGADGDVYKPFTLNFKEREGNNWRNSFDIQAGLGCDAPYSPEYLLSEAYLAESRFDCPFREMKTGQCTSPSGHAGESRTCFNPNKNELPPDRSTAAQPRPKLLKRDSVDNEDGYFYVEPSIEVLADLLGKRGIRVPFYPFAAALYGGSEYWASRNAIVAPADLAEKLALDDERFYTLFDTDPQSRFNLQFLETIRSPQSEAPQGSPAPSATSDNAPKDVAGAKAQLSVPVSFKQRPDTQFRTQAGREQDPERRARLLERATNAHRQALNSLAEVLASRGYQLDEQLDGYDLLAIHPDNSLFLFEVKTWTPSNLGKQVRSGWAQLYEYVYRNRARFGDRSPRLYLLFDSKPPEDFWAWPWLVQDLSVVPTWVSGGNLRTFDDYGDLLPPPIQ